MGLVKQEGEEYLERGWGAPGDKFVLFPPRQQQSSFTDLVNFSKAEEIEFLNWMKLSGALCMKV